jgi:hypothetical protein
VAGEPSPLAVPIGPSLVHAGRGQKRRVALVLSIVRGETSVAEAARKHGLTVAEVEEWQKRFVAAENGTAAA